MQFLLPDELGWKCNDEISEYLDSWMTQAAQILPTKEGGIDMVGWELAKAQLMDEVYAIIKKHQNLVKPSQQVKSKS